MKWVVDIAEACRMYLLLVLLLSTGGKLVGIRAFSKSVSDSLKLGRRSGVLVAVAVTSAEGLIMLLLMCGGVEALLGMKLALLLFVIMTVVLAASVRMKQPMYCQCFGQASHVASVYDVSRNAIVIVAAAFGAMHLSDTKSPDLVSSMMLFGIGTIVFIISANLREIVSLVW